MHLFDPLNLAFFACFLAYVGIRHVYQSRAGANDKVDRRVDAAEVALLIAVTTCSLLLPVLYLVSPWLDFAGYGLPMPARVAGVGFLLLGLWLFWRSHADLGVNWSVSLEVRQGHELVTGGVYRRIRHPMYAAIFLFALGQGLVLQNWLAGWGALLTFSVLYAHRVPREEQMMRDTFGADYESYAARTGRIFPWR